MYGTDAVIHRAAQLALETLLCVVKVAKPDQDMRFDVPLVGVPTIAVMQECSATAMSVDAGRTLLFDRDQMLTEANAAGITIVGISGSPSVRSPSRI